MDERIGQISQGETITRSDVQYAAKMLPVFETIRLLQERYTMQTWHPAFWVRWYLLRLYFKMLGEKTAAHNAEQKEEENAGR